MAVECPFCDWSGDSFLPAGANQEPNRFCPRCRSLNRHRLIFLYLQLETTIMYQPNVMLHIAPEQSLRKFLRKLPNLTYVTSDLVSQNVQVQADICQLPFRDESFDLLLASHVMEHVPDDGAAIDSIRRVLKPGGIALLLFPYTHNRLTDEDPSVTDPEERLRRFKQRDHVRFPGYDYPDRIRSHRFTVREDRYTNELPDSVVELHALDRGTIIFRCTKSDGAQIADISN